MEEGTRKSGDLWSGVALAALGLYIVFQARQWEYLGPEGPGAGFFPLWYGIAILGLSLLLIVSHFRRGSHRGNAIDWTRLVRAFSTWFALAVEPANLFWCFVGVLLGTVGGILPGRGPPATIAMLLPLTFNMNPAGAIIMLAGIYYGAKYGGSTTSILMNVPGESASVVTCLDGYQMARKGRAGPALGIAAIASFVAGTVGVLGLMLVAPPLAKLALAFSAPEYFGLMSLGLAMVVLLAGRSMAKALLAMLVGLWIAGIGTDVFTSQSRFTFGRMELLSGIDFVVVAIGIFAIGEVLANMESREEPKALPVPKGLRNLLPTRQDLR